MNKGEVFMNFRLKLSLACTNMPQKNFLHKLLNVLNIFWIYGDIPEEWWTAVVKIGRAHV
jgi:hypothetical protein